MDTGRFGRPQNRAKIVRIFDPVKKHQERLFASRLRPAKNLLHRTERLGRDICDDALMIPGRHQSRKGRRGFDVNRDSLDLRQLHEIRELPIGSHQEQPL